MTLNVYEVIGPRGRGYLIIAGDAGCAAVVACRLDKLDAAQAEHCTVTLQRILHG